MYTIQFKGLGAVSLLLFFKEVNAFIHKIALNCYSKDFYNVQKRFF